MLRLDEVKRLLAWLQDAATNPLTPFPVDSDVLRRTVQTTFRTT